MCWKQEVGNLISMDFNNMGKKFVASKPIFWKKYGICMSNNILTIVT